MDDDAVEGIRSFKSAYQNIRNSMQVGKTESDLVRLLMRETNPPLFLAAKLKESSKIHEQTSPFSLRGWEDVTSSSFPVRFVVANTPDRGFKLADFFSKKVKKHPILEEYFDVASDEDEDDSRPLCLVSSWVGVGLIGFHDGSVRGSFDQPGRTMLVVQLPRKRGIVCLDQLSAWVSGIVAAKLWTWRRLYSY